MEKTLQYEEAPQCLGLPSTSPGNHRLNGPKADHALTFTLDLSMGANQGIKFDWNRLKDCQGAINARIVLKGGAS